jgi:hypothetical protein
MDRLRDWDAEYNLGFILRQSRNPDLLLETIRLHGTQSVVSWLGPVLQRYPTTVDAVPELTIAQLLFADLTQSVAAEKKRRPDAHRLDARACACVHASSMQPPRIPLHAGHKRKLATSKLRTSYIWNISAVAGCTIAFRVHLVFSACCNFRLTSIIFCRSTMDLSRMVERLAVPLSSTTPPTASAFDLFAEQLCSASAINRAAAVKVILPRAQASRLCTLHVVGECHTSVCGDESHE